MVVTASVVIENVRMSRHSKAELVAYRIHKQPSPIFTQLLPLKPDHSPVSPVCLESVQHLVLTSESCIFQTVHWNRPYR
jgi:hypothetical protein